MIRTNEAIQEAPALELCIDVWKRDCLNKVSPAHIPLEVVMRGIDNTDKYLEQLNRSTRTFNRVKIGVIGSGSSGKTSLVKSITTMISSLEHPDKRTIGIDHYSLPFAKKRRNYESTLWDFVGQDVYQGSHSLFFTRRTIYFVCADLNSHSVARKQSLLLANNNSQVDRLMNDFVEVKLLKWIRLVVARQPDAEFVFVATKMDMIKRHVRLAKDSRVDIEKRLQQYITETTNEIKKLVNQRVFPGGSQQHTAMGVDLSIDQLETLQHTLERLLKHDWMTVSCVDAQSITDTRAKIEDIIAASDRSFPMPESYSKALESIREMQISSSSAGSLAQVESAFLNVEDLIAVLHTKNPDVDVKTYREILRTLHDLGDILWYEDLGIAQLKHEVILNPMLLIDFIRPIADHKYKSEILPHRDLKCLSLWRDLDQVRMLTMKELLHKFNLVYTPGQVMKWNDDLIVPASWKSKTPATLRFSGQTLAFEFSRLSIGTDAPAAIAPTPALESSVRWEYHFVALPSEPVFDQIVIASYDPIGKRQVGPDWILYEKKGQFALRIIIDRFNPTKERVICLEAVAANSSTEMRELWVLFKQLCRALERVLYGFRGLVVSRCAINEDNEPRELRSIVDKWMKTEPSDRIPRPWLPPSLEWYTELLKELAEAC